MNRSILFGVLVFGSCSSAFAGTISKQHTFSSGGTISSSQVNTNFNDLFTEVNVKEADNWVTTARINASAVTTAKITDSAVTTAKIADGAVTAAKLASAAVDKSIAGGRLTLTSGTAVTTSDVTAATTVYYTPYVSDAIALYDGSSTWTIYTFSELSLSVPASTATNYDVFAYNNSGSVALEALAWTDNTTRATAITLQNGVYVKSGTTTRRYLGTFRTTSVSGQTEMSGQKRFVFNLKNRVRRASRAAPWQTWSLNSTAWSWVAMNSGDSNYKYEFVVGVNEEPVTAYFATAFNSGNANIGVGVDSTTVGAVSAWSNSTNAMLGVYYSGTLGVGYHYINGLHAAGATSSFGNLNSIVVESVQ